MQPSTLRPFQIELPQAALVVAERTLTDDPADRTVVAHVAPGSGKTLAYLLALDGLFRNGTIDAAMILVPRLNLAEQVAETWATTAPGIAGAMGPITQRGNILPLLRDDAFGYVTTYQSVMSSPELHGDFVASGRVAVVLDEAQQLGVEGPSGQGTRSAEVVRQLCANARLVIVLSGTPTRTDGTGLLFARYAPPDLAGWRALIPDVEASYPAGVAGGYLREFEAELYDGTGRWCPIAEGEEDESLDLILSTLDGGYGRLISQPGYWEALVDRAVQKLRAIQREIDPRLRGLIGATDQTQAKAILAYLARAHPGVRVLLATQDEASALRNLHAFREGEGDILVTCQMAHIGYDAPAIAVVTPLTLTRQDPWLRQFVARGMRVIGGLPVEMQCCYLIGPADPPMVEFCVRLRRESVAGLRERLPREEGRGTTAGGNPGAAVGGIGMGAKLTGARIIGYDATGDADVAELAEVEALSRAAGIGDAYPLHKLVAFARILRRPEPVGGAAPNPGVAVAQRGMAVRLPRTARERETDLRRDCAEIARTCDGWIRANSDPKWAFGETNRRAKAQFEMPVKSCGVHDLETRLAWLKDFYRDEVRRRAWHMGA